MKVTIGSISFLILILLSACHSDLVQKNYETNILKNVVSFTIPQFQSNNELKIIKNNKVKSISFILYRDDKIAADSLTFVEYDIDGKIIRKTTTENTTQGCLPYMMRQEFSYSNNKIKRVTDYTFRYKANSILHNWTLRDTSKLNMFDWEDYTYSGDTIIVESGAAINTYIIDKNGDVIKRTILTKTDKKTSCWEYEFNDNSIIQKFDSPSYSDIIISKYLVSNNLVDEGISRNNKNYTTIYSFNEKGLLKSKTFYVNKEKQNKIIANYSYYK